MSITFATHSGVTARRIRTKRRILSFTAALMFGIGAAPSVLAANEYPWLAKSVTWRPQHPDAATMALYHFDDGVAGEIATDFDIEAAEPDSLLSDEPAASNTASNTASNAVSVGPSASFQGGAKFTNHGRFHAGVQLAGGGRIDVPALKNQATFRTVQAWLKVTTMPADSAVIFLCERAKTRRPNEHDAANYNRQLGDGMLLLASDGSLNLSWFGKSLTIPHLKLKTGQWHHLSLAFGYGWPWNSVVRITLDQQSPASFPVSRFQSSNLARFSQRLLVGANSDGQQGLAAVVDELQVSRNIREYHKSHQGRLNPASSDAKRWGRPWFRDASDLQFRLPFDQTLAPSHHAEQTGFPTYSVTEEERALYPQKVAQTFPVGVEGHGLLLGADSPSPSYIGGANFSTKRGAITFWIQPVDWDNFTRDNWLDRTNPTIFGLFQVYGKYADGSYQRRFHERGPLLEFNIVMHIDNRVDDPVPLHPGKWTHVVMNWEGPELNWLIDGERRVPSGAWHAWMPIHEGNDRRKGTHADWWLNTSPEEIRFGKQRYWPGSKRQPQTWIDDFRVYRRPLTQQEAQNIIAQSNPSREAKPLAPAEMSMTWNGVKGEVDVQLTNQSEHANDTLDIEVTVTNADKQTLGRQMLRFDGLGQAAGEVRTKPLPFGNYQVRADIRDRSNQQVGTVRQSFTRHAPPWWQSQAGVSDQVPSPWTAVRTEGRSVSVWGRKLIFGADGLLHELASQDKPVLAAPISIEAKANGKPCQLRANKEQWRIVAENGRQVTVHGESESTALAVHTETRVEFDGMIWLKTTLTPQSDDCHLEQLTVTIPYEETAAELVHWWSGDREFRDPKVVHIGELPKKEGVLFSSNSETLIKRPANLRGNFLPYVMLTGMDRGMAWFAENDKGWTANTKEAAITVERHDGVVYLKLHVINQPTAFKAPRTFEFGLHPTPIRPLRANWRMRPNAISDAIPDTFSGNNLKGRRGPSTFNIAPEDDWDAVQRRIDGEGLTKGAAGLKSLAQQQLAAFQRQHGRPPEDGEGEVPGLYWDLQYPGTFPEHCREWQEVWGWQHGDWLYHTKEFIDYASWAWEQWLTQTKGFIRGAYIDDCWNRPEQKAAAPTTYTLPDGHVQAGFTFLGYRERLMRMYQTSQAHGIHPRITGHSTHTMFIPYHAFFSLVLDGEDYYSVPSSQLDFIDKWPFARLRFMHNAKWGVTTTWLGWHGNDTHAGKWPAWQFRQQRAYVAAMAAHDIRWDFAGGIVHDFGLRQEDTVFVPYWSKAPLVQTGAAKLYACGWRRGDRFLLLLVNAGERLDKVELTIKPSAMGLEHDAERRCWDRDANLLTYFDDDVTTLNADDARPSTELNTDDDLPDLEEAEDELPLEERRRRDPDGFFHWDSETLKCTIRRHDYRLFELGPHE